MNRDDIEKTDVFDRLSSATIIVSNLKMVEDN